MVVYKAEDVVGCNFFLRENKFNIQQLTYLWSDMTIIPLLYFPINKYISWYKYGKKVRTRKINSKQLILISEFMQQCQVNLITNSGVLI